MNSLFMGVHATKFQVEMLIRSDFSVFTGRFVLSSSFLFMMRSGADNTVKYPINAVLLSARLACSILSNLLASSMSLMESGQKEESCQS